MYIAIEGSSVKAMGISLADIYRSLLEVRIEKSGKVWVNGKLYPMSYNMNDYTVDSALENFFTSFAHKCVSKYITICKSI